MQADEKYKGQDRGTEDGYKKYMEAMDSVVVEKVASASVFFDPSPNTTIVDVGMASGLSSHILGLLFPESKIIGVDINPTMVEKARTAYRMPNLSFVTDDGEKLESLDNNSVSGFFSCSSIHHITSFNNYDPIHAVNTIKRQCELLHEAGIIVIRDFVKPPEMEVILELSNNDGKNSGTGLTDAELLIQFSKTSRALSKQEEKGFPLTELDGGINSRRFMLPYSDAVEFIRRKDYQSDWDIELQEEYAYFTQAEFEEIFANLGMRIILSSPIYNPWIIRNRYKNKFQLFDLQNKSLGYPPTNYIIAAEKHSKKGVRINGVRQLPLLENNFLKIKSYMNKETGFIYDIAERPNKVIDLLPYFINDNKQIMILAKHGYPRPFLNTNTDSTLLDRKHYSGYMTEALTVLFDSNFEIEKIKTSFEKKTGISKDNIDSPEKSLEYYTSPGGINEVVLSYLLPLKGHHTLATVPGNYSGFKDSGTLRYFDAVQLLKTAQTGALSEARLELNIYNLFRKHCMEPGPWLADKIEIEELQLERASSLKSALSIPVEIKFESSTQQSGFLKHKRMLFQEKGVDNSNNILEYIIPSTLSINTVSLLPIILSNGEFYAGIETRFLPVPQMHSGNCRLYTVPAIRLSKEITTFTKMEEYVKSIDFYGTKITELTRLGEKYFPSCGITPEQVYPFVVCVEKASKDLNWIKLEELFKNIELLKDGHMLVSVMRSVHALGKWKDYL